MSSTRSPSSAPLVSVIMPSHNSTAHIAQAVDSIVAQTMTDWELCITDDASTDETVAYLQGRYGHDDRIHIMALTQNGGAAIARNTSIEAAKGRYIAFLDSDDAWLPNKLEKQLALHENPDVHFSFTAYDLMNEEGGASQHTMRAKGDVTYKDMLNKCHIGCLTAMYDSQSLGKVFMPLIKKRQDYGLWLRILRKTPKAYLLDESLSLYRMGGQNSLSKNKMALVRYNWLLFREHEEFSLIKSTWCLTKNIINKIIDMRKQNKLQP